MLRSQPVSVYAPQINRMNTRYMLLSGAPPFVTLHRCIAEFQVDVSPTFKHREEAAETARPLSWEAREVAPTDRELLRQVHFLETECQGVNAQSSW